MCVGNEKVVWCGCLCCGPGRPGASITAGGWRQHHKGASRSSWTGRACQAPDLRNRGLRRSNYPTLRATAPNDQNQQGMVWHGRIPIWKPPTCFSSTRRTAPQHLLLPLTRPGQTAFLALISDQGYASSKFSILLSIKPTFENGARSLRLPTPRTPLQSESLKMDGDTGQIGHLVLPLSVPLLVSDC